MICMELLEDSEVFISTSELVLIMSRIFPGKNTLINLSHEMVNSGVEYAVCENTLQDGNASRKKIMMANLDVIWKDYSER